MTSDSLQSACLINVPPAGPPSPPALQHAGPGGRLEPGRLASSPTSSGPLAGPMSILVVLPALVQGGPPPRSPLGARVGGGSRPTRLWGGATSRYCDVALGALPPRRAIATWGLWRQGPSTSRRCEVDAPCLSHPARGQGAAPAPRYCGAGFHPALLQGGQWLAQSPLGSPTPAAQRCCPVFVSTRSVYQSGGWE